MMYLQFNEGWLTQILRVLMLTIFNIIPFQIELARLRAT